MYALPQVVHGAVGLDAGIIRLLVITLGCCGEGGGQSQSQECCFDHFPAKHFTELIYVEQSSVHACITCLHVVRHTAKLGYKLQPAIERASTRTLKPL